MSEAPKLYVNKPKKAQLKQKQHKSKQFSSPTPSSSSSMEAQNQAAGYSSSSSSSSKPPPSPPKESFARRYRFLWPLLLTVNLAVGAYLFMRTKKKETDTDGEVKSDVPSTPVSTAAVTTAPVEEKPLPAAPIAEPVKPREPIPENQQRELFKWLLEEKRKVKPKDAEEKKRIDEEKAILKHFIRAQSIPNRTNI
ncbi:hypothetical protein RJ641_019880 [Dillenia turbinata]|uniref:Uncharacterized protein n=1 Tax=Dillenia turbinata TaxID=194707 RepID=A0AAN8YZ25_9MAGN